MPDTDTGGPDRGRDEERSAGTPQQSAVRGGPIQDEDTGVGEDQRHDVTVRGTHTGHLHRGHDTSSITGDIGAGVRWWRYVTPGWLLGHVVVVGIAAGCLRLGWWQWEHALTGNTVSYGYAAQWPLFAAFGVFFWIRILHDRVQRQPSPADRRVDDARPSARVAVPRTHGCDWTFRGDRIPAALRAPTQDAAPAPRASVDPDEAAYNARLAWLNADPRRRVMRYERDRAATRAAPRP